MLRRHRTLRTLWPEIVFGMLWIVLLGLMHTLFTDDDAWPHRLIDGLQWAVFAGYVVATLIAHQRSRSSLRAID